MSRLLILLLLAGCTGDGISRAVGARCEDETQCSDRCLPEPVYPGGFCTLDCSNDADCPGDTVCVDVEGGVCMFLCRDERDCDFLGETAAGGWACESKDPIAGGATVLVCDGD